jgi:phage protein D
VVALSGFGIFDGNWIIEKVRHKIGRSSGFTTELSLRLCLDY